MAHCLGEIARPGADVRASDRALWAVLGWTVLLVALDVVLTAPAFVCGTMAPGYNAALCDLVPDPLWATKGLVLLIVWAVGVVGGVWWRRRRSAAGRVPE